MKTPLFYVGTLDRIRNSGYKFNHTKEVMIIFQFKEKDNCLTKRAKVDFFYSFMLPNPSIKARQFHQYNVAKSIKKTAISADGRY